MTENHTFGQGKIKFSYVSISKPSSYLWEDIGFLSKLGRELANNFTKTLRYFWLIQNSYSQYDTENTFLSQNGVLL